MVTLTTIFQICMMNLILESNCIIRVSADKEATAPEIINGPVNATVFVDRNHTFICKTKGYPGPDITWQKKVGKTDQWKNVDKSGRLRWAGDNLVINRVLGSDMGFYRCVAFNNFKNTSSGIAYLNVEAVASIVKGPRNHTVTWGTNVTLSCEAVGMPMPARSWYKNGTVMKKQPADPPISVPKFSFNATESTMYECRVQNTHMEGMTNASAVAYVRVIDGKCKSYEGNVCRSHLNGRELIFSKLSDLAYESKMEEHLLSVEREMRKSNVSESCSGRALRVLCKMAFPICRVKGRVAVKQPLCKESCQAVKNLFCGEWWTNPSSKPPLDCQDLPLNRTSENCEFISFFETGNETTICYTGVGAQYRGNVKVTVSGYKCQAWNSSYPHKHRLNPVLIPDLRANHCRNPGGLKDRPWCFTNGSVEWEYCNVTICENSTTTTVDPNPQEISTYLYAIVSAIFVVLFVVVLAGACLFMCRLRKCQRSHNITTYRTPDDENLMSELQQLPSVEVVPPQAAKSTVFSKYEFDRNLVVHIEDIALGAFGPVFKARLDSRQGGDQNGPVENCHDPDKQFVAVKMLKDGSHESVQLEFVRQASLIASFDHPNIVKLVGVCFIGSPLCVALEFMGRGDLHSLLPALKPSHFIYSSKYYVRQLLIVRQLVSVLVHLEQLRFLHRDLAARNFLVGSDNLEDNAPLVKLADFGLAVKLEPGENVHVGVESEAIAVRWTAPESITQGHFTFSSDVWSFGVLLWEVFSYGEKPYKNLHSLEDVSRFILNGGQLESPCPDHPEVFDLMRKCWHVQPKTRCSAKFLSTSLGEIFKNL